MNIIICLFVRFGIVLLNCLDVCKIIFNNLLLKIILSQSLSFHYKFMHMNHQIPRLFHDFTLMIFQNNFIIITCHSFSYYLLTGICLLVSFTLNKCRITQSLKSSVNTIKKTFRRFGLKNAISMKSGRYGFILKQLNKLLKTNLNYMVSFLDLFSFKNYYKLKYILNNLLSI